MNDPRGSVEHAVSDELERLRRRAYGPGADIAGDAVAQARLSELETAQRRQPTSVVDAGAWTAAPMLERVRVFEPAERPTDGREHEPTKRDSVVGQSPTGGEQADGLARGGAAIPWPPAALETQLGGPRKERGRHILPWVISAGGVLVAAIAIGGLVLNEASELQPVARLTPQADSAEEAIPIDEEIARKWQVMDADFVWHGSYGAAEIWSATTAGPKQCLAVVVLGGTWKFNCTPPTIDTIADLDINPNLVPPAPSGEPASNIRFVLHDGVVDVYLVPHPDGGFYS